MTCYFIARLTGKHISCGLIVDIPIVFTLLGAPLYLEQMQIL